MLPGRIWTPSDRDQPAALAVMRRCLDLDPAKAVRHGHHDVVGGGFNREQHAASAQREPSGGDRPASLSQMLEVRHERVRFRHDGNVSFKVVEVQAEADRVALDVRSRASAIDRETESREHLVPRAGVGHSIPELRVRPSSFSAEVRRVKVKTDRMPTHDPDRASRYLVQVQLTHHATPVAGSLHGLRQLHVSPCTLLCGKSTHTRTVARGSDIPAYVRKTVGTAGFEPAISSPPDLHLNRARPRPVADRNPGWLPYLSASRAPPGN